MTPKQQFGEAVGAALADGLINGMKLMTGADNLEEAKRRMEVVAEWRDENGFYE